MHMRLHKSRLYSKLVTNRIHFELRDPRQMFACLFFFSRQHVPLLCSMIVSLNLGLFALYRYLQDVYYNKDNISQFDVYSLE